MGIKHQPRHVSLGCEQRPADYKSEVNHHTQYIEGIVKHYADRKAFQFIEVASKSEAIDIKLTKES